ncbi:MAG: endonuclease/exonuclease/phosphatase family protein [Tannerella sp.]|jgi:endonuclease/exonuclease/phosphatase family metal-dependent hydrolase|nr:endonuclease/exonuclease/phosphatase family protein [Tannerella sp.]
MKQFVCACLLAFALASCSNKPVDLNVMSFNIRYDNPADSLNNWKYRKDVAAQAVKMNDVDLLGTQEVLVNQLNDLKARLPEYTALGVGRDDGKTAGEYSAIFYKTKRFENLKSGTFWLSATPDVAGSKGWDGGCRRIATWAVLKDKATGRDFFYINTHLDNVGKIARKEGVTVLLKRAKLYAGGRPIIITGDFNSTPQSEVYAHVTSDGIYRDSRIVAKTVLGNAKGTFHDFGKIPPEKREFIDYVFVTKQFQVDTFRVLPEKIDTTYLSDHCPILANLTLK